MFEIQTFTAQPDFAEDRIRLDAVSADGQFLSIFLTRRLCDRFLPMLVAQVETDVRPGLPREIDLAMNQQQLRIEREENPLADVEPPAGVRPWLCLTIHLTAHPDGLEWVMTDDAAQQARMMLVDAGSRAVLDIFLLMYRHLEWSGEVFPDWLTSEAAMARPAAATLN